MTAKKRRGDPTNLLDSALVDTSKENSPVVAEAEGSSEVGEISGKARVTATREMAQRKIVADAAPLLAVEAPTESSPAQAAMVTATVEEVAELVERTEGRLDEDNEHTESASKKNFDAAKQVLTLPNGETVQVGVIDGSGPRATHFTGELSQTAILYYGEDSISLQFQKNRERYVTMIHKSDGTRIPGGEVVPANLKLLLEETIKQLGVELSKSTPAPEAATKSPEQALESKLAAYNLDSNFDATTGELNLWDRRTVSTKLNDYKVKKQSGSKERISLAYKPTVGDGYLLTIKVAKVANVWTASYDGGIIGDHNVTRSQEIKPKASFDFRNFFEQGIQYFGESIDEKITADIAAERALNHKLENYSFEHKTGVHTLMLWDESIVHLPGTSNGTFDSTFEDGRKYKAIGFSEEARDGKICTGYLRLEQKNAPSTGWKAVGYYHNGTVKDFRNIDLANPQVGVQALIDGFPAFIAEQEALATAPAETNTEAALEAQLEAYDFSKSFDQSTGVLELWDGSTLDLKLPHYRVVADAGATKIGFPFLYDSTLPGQSSYQFYFGIHESISSKGKREALYNVIGPGVSIYGDATIIDATFNAKDYFEAGIKAFAVAAEAEKNKRPFQEYDLHSEDLILKDDSKVNFSIKTYQCKMTEPETGKKWQFTYDPTHYITLESGSAPDHYVIKYANGGQEIPYGSTFSVKDLKSNLEGVINGIRSTVETVAAPEKKLKPAELKIVNALQQAWSEVDASGTAERVQATLEKLKAAGIDIKNAQLRGMSELLTNLYDTAVQVEYTEFDSTDGGYGVIESKTDGSYLILPIGREAYISGRIASLVYGRFYDVRGGETNLDLDKVSKGLGKDYILTKPAKFTKTADGKFKVAERGEIMLAADAQAFLRNQTGAAAPEAAPTSPEQALEAKLAAYDLKTNYDFRSGTLALWDGTSADFRLNGYAVRRNDEGIPIKDNLNLQYDPAGTVDDRNLIPFNVRVYKLNADTWMAKYSFEVGGKPGGEGKKITPGFKPKDFFEEGVMKFGEAIKAAAPVEVAPAVARSAEPVAPKTPEQKNLEAIQNYKFEKTREGKVLLWDNKTILDLGTWSDTRDESHVAKRYEGKDENSYRFLLRKSDDGNTMKVMFTRFELGRGEIQVIDTVENITNPAAVLAFKAECDMFLAGLTAPTPEADKLSIAPADASTAEPIVNAASTEQNTKRWSARVEQYRQLLKDQGGNIDDATLEFVDVANLEGNVAIQQALEDIAKNLVIGGAMPQEKTALAIKMGLSEDDITKILDAETQYLVDQAASRKKGVLTGLRVAANMGTTMALYGSIGVAAPVVTMLTDKLFSKLNIFGSLEQGATNQATKKLHAKLQSGKAQEECVKDLMVQLAIKKREQIAGNQDTLAQQVGEVIRDTYTVPGDASTDPTMPFESKHGPIDFNDLSPFDALISRHVHTKVRAARNMVLERDFGGKRYSELLGQEKKNIDEFVNEMTALVTMETTNAVRLKLVTQDQQNQSSAKQHSQLDALIAKAGTILKTADAKINGPDTATQLARTAVFAGAGYMARNAASALGSQVLTGYAGFKVGGMIGRSSIGKAITGKLAKFGESLWKDGRVTNDKTIEQLADASLKEFKPGSVEQARHQTKMEQQLAALSAVDNFAADKVVQLQQRLLNLSKREIAQAQGEQFVVAYLQITGAAIGALVGTVFHASYHDKLASGTAKPAHVFGSRGEQLFSTSPAAGGPEPVSAPDSHATPPPEATPKPVTSSSVEHGVLKVNEPAASKVYHQVKDPTGHFYTPEKSGDILKPQHEEITAAATHTPGEGTASLVPGETAHTPKPVAERVVPHKFVDTIKGTDGRDYESKSLLALIKDHTKELGYTGKPGAQESVWVKQEFNRAMTELKGNHEWFNLTHEGDKVVMDMGADGHAHYSFHHGDQLPQVDLPHTHTTSPLEPVTPMSPTLGAILEPVSPATPLDLGGVHDIDTATSHATTTSSEASANGGDIASRTPIAARPGLDQTAGKVANLGADTAAQHSAALEEQFHFERSVDMTVMQHKILAALSQPENHGKLTMNGLEFSHRGNEVLVKLQDTATLPITLTPELQIALQSQLHNSVHEHIDIAKWDHALEEAHRD